MSKIVLLRLSYSFSNILQAFAEGANAALGNEVSEEDELKQHYSQVWRALFVLLGIYLFFFVEQMMKWKALCSKVSSRKIVLRSSLVLIKETNRMF